MFAFHPTPLPDAVLIDLPAFRDERGVFVKTFQESVLLKEQLDFELKESYFSFSQKDVIRGMHFQLPPHQHKKIVFCPQGRILDVILDLRIGSPGFKKFFATELSAEQPRALFIPEGFAHGFRALEEHSMTYYLVSSEYNKGKDSGIRWDSFGFDWDTATPLLSERDRSFRELKDLDSPF
jgi:dTDP-4-dehydrorhamnose 3,5-epimerase/CDP-3, 6-dideoxy-D-glycero-D-glycero-4-hexulose-5-epimerase